MRVSPTSPPDAPRMRARGGLASRARLALLAVCAVAAVGCTTATAEGPDDALFAAPPVSFRELRTELLRREPELALFEQAGPFKVEVRENVAIRLPGSVTLIVDVARPLRASKAPLVIIAHGNHSHKEAHRYQAERLASFGMYVVAVQLPNTDQWVANGRLVGRLVRKLRASPRLVGDDVDTDALILAGHSFGGSAVTLAAGAGAAVRGLILLDPAVVADAVIPSMRRVRQPVMLLGADRAVFRSRKRRAFGKNVAGEFGEVSVTGATHDDAQEPSMFALSALGVDPYTSPEHQRLFTAAIAATAFSLGATGKLDYAWTALAPLLRAGDLRDAHRRPARQTAARDQASAE